MGRRVLLALLSAAVLAGLVAQPGAAVNVPQAVVVSSNPADWTPHVLDGKVAAIVQVGNRSSPAASSPRWPAPPPPPRRSPAATSSPSTPPPGRATPRTRRCSTPRSRRWPWPRRAARVRRRQLHQDQRGRPEEPGQAAPQRRRPDHRVQGQDQRPGQGHGRQRRAPLHRRHLQDRQRRGRQRPGRRRPGHWGALGRRQPGLHWPPQRHRQHRQVRHHLRRRPAQQCARVFDTYMRDVDISPDGSYFVVGTIVAYRAATPSTASPSPAPPCTSAATSAG